MKNSNAIMERMADTVLTKLLSSVMGQSKNHVSQDEALRSIKHHLCISTGMHKFFQFIRKHHTNQNWVTFYQEKKKE